MARTEDIPPIVVEFEHPRAKGALTEKFRLVITDAGSSRVVEKQMRDALGGTGWCAVAYGDDDHVLCAALRKLFSLAMTAAPEAFPYRPYVNLGEI